MRSRAFLAGNPRRFGGIGWVCGLALLSSACAGCRPPPWVTVRGTVVDATTLEPLSDVKVSWKDSNVTTDTRGRYTMKLRKGVRRLTYSPTDRSAVWKAIVLVGDATFDAAIPTQPESGAMIVDRYPAFDSAASETWPSEFDRFGWAVVDAYGNGVQPLGLGGSIAHRAPVWTEPGAFQVTAAPVIVPREYESTLGVYRYDIAQQAEKPTALGLVPDFQYMACSPDGQRCLTSGLYGLHITEGSRLVKIDALQPNNDRKVAGVAWGADGRLYVTVEEVVQVDPATLPNAHHAGSLARGPHILRSRIAALQPDGSGLEPRWAAADDNDCEHPFVLPGGTDVYYCRRGIQDGATSLWARPPSGGQARLVAEGVCVTVWIDEDQHRIYHKVGDDLRLKDLRSGRELVLLNELVVAAYRRWKD